MNMYDKIVKSMDGTEGLLDKKYCAQITKMPQQNLEDIYLLILHHYVSREKISKDNLINGKDFPYGSKLISKDGRGLVFKPMNLPEYLQKIVVRYIKTIVV